MKRLFVFGCSFTHYAWPTWGDLLGTQFDYSENWGWPGLGNRAIVERIAECHSRNKFTKDDTVIVQWTSHVRHDWYKTNNVREPGWQTKGSIFNYLNSDTFNKNWVDTFWDERAYFMHTMNYILLAQGILNSTKCNWRMTTITDLSKLGKDYPNDTKLHGEVIDTDITNIWEENADLIFYKKSIFTENADKWITPLGLYAWKDLNKSFKFRDKLLPKKWIDFHPSIIQHNEWLTNQLIPSLHISQNQPVCVKEMIDIVNNLYNSCNYDFNTFCSSVNKDLKEWIIPYRGF